MDTYNNSGQFSLTLKALKKLPPSTYIVIKFENPIDIGRPIVTEQRWRSGKNEANFLSKKIKGLDCGYYWANISIYESRSKKKLLGIHRQLIQSRVSLVNASGSDGLMGNSCM